MNYKKANRNYSSDQRRARALGAPEAPGVRRTGETLEKTKIQSTFFIRKTEGWKPSVDSSSVYSGADEHKHVFSFQGDNMRAQAFPNPSMSLPTSF